LKRAEPEPSHSRQLPPSEEHGSVPVPKHPSFWRRLFAFAGPAYLVSVGYMDPGNWATDIAGGSRYGYALIWVLLMSNVMAVLLQSLSARLGIVTRMDLAQACRAMFNRPVAWVLWVLAEVAIAACDLAEVLGSAIGLQLLFGLPLLLGVALTAFDTLIILGLQSRGVRAMEAFIVALVTTIGACLALEIVLSKPDWIAMGRGFVPTLPDGGALYLAIGILGATVMPHNLYLHSALVQSRRISHTPAGIRSGVRFNVIDSVVALNAAFLVNAALLVMAAATFYRTGLHDVTEIQDAHRLLEPILGATIAPIAFAVALILSGQSSSITGTLAGQVVMEGFVRLRLRPLVRRLVTRSVAIVPAVITITAFGDRGAGELLVLSQVVLSLQLPFAVIPLVHIVSDRRWMGHHAISTPTAAAAWLVASVIALLNMSLAYQVISGWLLGSTEHLWLPWLAVVPSSLGFVGLLGYVSVVPFLERWRNDPTPVGSDVHGTILMPPVRPAGLPKRIAVAVDFSRADGPVLSHVVSLARAAGRGAQLLLFHVVEYGGARLLGEDHAGREARDDRERLEMYAAGLQELGVEADVDLGFGDPALALSRLVREYLPELLVVGSHGHGPVGDFVHGTTVERLRHLVEIPVLVVPGRERP
jgi:manganese transport protein